MSTLKVDYIQSFTTAQPVIISDNLITSGAISIELAQLPTSDPSILGRLYRTGSAGDEIRISLG